MTRFIEVYTGAYASGKSEIAINRALYLHRQGVELTLVDLDTVEPAYTLRPIKKQLQSLGLSVVAHDREDSFGLGESGTYIIPSQKMCLHRKENLILDVGYGSGGLDVLTLLEDLPDEPDVRLYMVINPCKFETSSVENIIEHVQWSTIGQKQTWKLTGFICNPHFSDQTQVEDIIKGYKIVKEASEKLNIPILAINMQASLLEAFKQTGFEGVEIWTIERYMPKALW
jgi:cellulose biosynthesis protein BcsQ